MSLENATKISELVATNPPGTDPVSQGDDHLRMVKQVLKNNAIKSEIGQSATPENNFTLDASADNGSMKLARSSGQDIMTVDAAGKVGFSIGILGFGYTTNAGSNIIVFPSWLGGICIQWGTNVPTAGSVQIALANLMADTAYSVLVTPDADLQSTSSLSYHYHSRTTSSFVVQSRYANNGGDVGAATQSFSWMVIGVKA